MVFRTRYLLLMALMLMLVNVVNTTGEYILGSIVKDTAVNLVAQGQNGGLTEGAADRRLLFQVLHARERASGWCCSSSSCRAW